MKELEKTQRLSIAAVLLILVVIIALLSYKRPEHMYRFNTLETLERTINLDYLLSLDELNDPNYILIDIRDPFEFEKGHLDQAINIPVSELLVEPYSNMIKEMKDQGKVMVLYGKTTNDVNSPFILLYQIGYQNVKILNVQNSYSQNELITNNMIIEDTVAKVNSFIEESIKKAEIAKKRSVEIKKNVPKKIVVKKKKKKMPVEGGC